MLWQGCCGSQSWRNACCQESEFDRREASHTWQCLERVSRLRFWKVLFGISCRFVCAGSGRFASAEFVCIRCSRPVKGRLGPIRWRRCAGAHRRGSAPSHRLFGRFPARLKRTQSSQRRRVQCAHQNSDRPGATNRSIVLC